MRLLSAPEPLSVCIRMSARLSFPAVIVTFVRASAKPGAETVISKIPAGRLDTLNEPSSFVATILVSPFPMFLMATRAFAIRAPSVLVILPERVPAVTWARN